jgi:alginate O-acetyltransferase complex protein AlgI
MLFDSLAFLVAFPLFSALFLAAPARFQPGLALFGSLAVCASFGWLTFAWLLLITLLGFIFGRILGQSGSSRQLIVMLFAVTAPLLVLKYTNFALSSAQSALAWAGVTLAIPRYDAVLPVGISFYTFVVIGYLIDVYIGRIQCESSPYRFALFTAFYPKFVAGPVERAATFLPQIEVAKRFDYDRVTDGLRIMGSGLFKKLVVADRLAVVVNGVYGEPRAFHGVALILTSIFYMFQLYYDFCGYSEIAVGAARVLGYDLTWNFNRPYAARSISDYWRRWHISLTSWFFEYIFAPVATSLRSWKSAAVVVAMMTTFLVSGLWHGAQWTFVLYGLVHGVAMCIDYLSVRPRKQLKGWVPPRVYAVLAWALTFVFVGCADVLFRASTIADAGTFLHDMVAGVPADLSFLLQHHVSAAALKGLVAGLPIPKSELLIAVGAIAGVEIAAFLGRRKPFRNQLLAQPVWVRWPVYYVVAGAILYLGSQNAATVFIYMRF